MMEGGESFPFFSASRSKDLISIATTTPASGGRHWLDSMPARGIFEMPRPLNACHDTTIE
jgi:hypothetical protein